MQAVADLHFLELTKVVVELGKRRVLGLVLGDAAVQIQADAPREIEDLARQHPKPARVHPRRLVIFVDQLFEVAQRPVGLGAGQRRRQMVDDRRRRPALGLGALAGIVDDEGIEVRCRPERGFGEAILGQRHRLAGQPFEIAVLAEVNDGVGGEFAP